MANSIEVINRMTVEAFKKECNTPKIMFRKVVDANKKPLNYKDAEGKDTGIQKRAIVDVAGNTVAWCSCAIARKFEEGESIKGLNLAVIQVLNEGKVYTSLCLANTSGEFEVEEL